MPEQLKIVIDADVNGAIAGVKNLSNVISGDFVKATETANASIGSIKQNISSLSGKGVTLGVNSDDAVQKIRALEQQLINLEALKISPDISSTQLTLFESNIQRIKAEIASLKTQALVVPIGVDVVKAQADVNILSESIETLRAKAEAKKIFITTETDITKIAAYNKEIQSLEAQVRRLQNVGKKGFELFVVPTQTISSVKNLTAQVAAFGGGVKTFIPPAIAGFNRLPSSISPAVNSLKALQAQALLSGNGFNALENSIQQSSGAFAPLIGGTQKAFSSLRQIALLIPGIGIGGIIGALGSALIDLASNIFTLEKETESATLVFNKFNAALEGTKETVDDLKIGIDFRESFSKLKAQAGGLSGEALDIFGLKKSIASNNEQIKNLDKQADDIAKPLARINAGIEKLRQKQLALELDPGLKLKGFTDAEIKKKFGDPILNVIDQFKDITLIPDSALEGLDKKDKEALQQLIKINKDLDPILKQREVLVNENELSIQKILIQRNEQLKKIQDAILARVRLFVKEFGDAFVLPDLTETFFKGKKELLPIAQKVLSDLSKGNLKIKLPVQAEFEFVPEPLPLTDAKLKEVTDNFFKSAQLERGINVDLPVNVDLTLPNKDQQQQLDKLLEGFSRLGTVGFKAFEKIDFTNFNAGLKEGTKTLQGMLDIANTLNQAIGSGLVNAFNSVFDAILEGKSVFKALGNAIKELVVGTIKAIAQMLILKVITNLIFPGGGAAIGGGAGGIGRLVGGLGGSANFGGIGNSPFSNIVQIVGAVNVSGQDLNIVLSRAQSSNGRF